MLQVALRGLAARKLRAFADGARDPPRRGDDRRHLRADGHDQQVVRRHLRRGARGHATSSSRRRRSSLGRAQRAAAVLGARCSTASRDVDGRRGGRGRDLRRSSRLDRRERRPARRRASRRTSPASTRARAVRPVHLRRGRVRRAAADEVAIDKSHRRPRGPRDRRHDRRRRRRAAASATAIVGIASSATRLARRRELAIADRCPRRSASTGKEGEFDEISIAAEPRASRRGARAPGRRGDAARRVAGRDRRGERRRADRRHQRTTSASSRPRCSCSRVSLCSSARS